MSSNICPVFSTISGWFIYVPKKIIIPSTSGWVPAVPLGCIALEDFGHTQGRVPDRGVGPDMVGLGMVGLQRWGVFKRFEITHVGQLLHKLCCDLNKCKETCLFFEAWNFVQCLTPSMFIVVFPIETFASANRCFLVGTGPGRQRDDIMRRFFLWPWTYRPWYFPRNINIYLDRYVLSLFCFYDDRCYSHHSSLLFFTHPLLFNLGTESSPAFISLISFWSCGVARHAGCNSWEILAV